MSGDPNLYGQDLPYTKSEQDEMVVRKNSAESRRLSTTVDYAASIEIPIPPTDDALFRKMMTQAHDYAMRVLVELIKEGGSSERE